MYVHAAAIRGREDFGVKDFAIQEEGWGARGVGYGLGRERVTSWEQAGHGMGGGRGGGVRNGGGAGSAVGSTEVAVINMGKHGLADSTCVRAA